MPRKTKEEKAFRKKCVFGEEIRRFVRVSFKDYFLYIKGLTGLSESEVRSRMRQSLIPGRRIDSSVSMSQETFNEFLSLLSDLRTEYKTKDRIKLHLDGHLSDFLKRRYNEEGLHCD